MLKLDTNAIKTNDEVINHMTYLDRPPASAHPLDICGSVTALVNTIAFIMSNDMQSLYIYLHVYTGR